MAARTQRQRDIFDYISSFIERHGYKPSYQQIARHFRIGSKSAVAKHVAALERQGLLHRRTETGAYSLTVQFGAEISEMICRVPFFEKLTDEFENDLLFVPRILLGDALPEKIYAFRVPTDSMIDEHICAGDIALIERKAFALDGECVAALIENRHPTIERFYDFGLEVELRPSNAHLNALRLPLEFVQICGVLRGLLRCSQTR